MLEKLLKLYQKLQTERQHMSFTLQDDPLGDWHILIFYEEFQTEIYSGDGSLEYIIRKAYRALKKWETETSD